MRFYTPVNEIYIAATYSAQFGWCNERLKTDRAFVNALKHLCKANVLAMHSILERTTGRHLHTKRIDAVLSSRRIRTVKRPRAPVSMKSGFSHST